MKKVYALCFALIAGLGLRAQVNVTFEVNMTGQTVSPNGLHIAGNFNDPDYDGSVYPADYNQGLSNWTPGDLELLETGMGTGIYAVTLPLNAARYEFKFINDNNWGAGEESIPQACQVGNGNSNREITIGASDVTYSICWASCAPCGENTVRFRVDLTSAPAISPNGVHVAGDFQNWQPGDSPLTDPDGNGIYEGYYNVGTATSINFKYVNGNAWVGSIIESIADGSACGGGPDGNRTETITEANTVLTAYCFNTCGTCVNPTAVTFQCDMSNETVSANGVHLAGSFGDNGYPAWSPGGIEMTDTNGDNVYEVTLNLFPGNYEFKVVNGDAWGGDESIPCSCASNNNRGVTVGAESMTTTFCFRQCGEVCLPIPSGSAPITFYVDMTGVTIGAEGVFMIGDFTTPQWQAGALAMTDMGNNIYSVTADVGGPLEIKYKFMKGDPNQVSNEEANIGDCACSNGLGGYNRVHQRSGSSEVLAGPCFDTCNQCFVGVEEQEVVANLMVYPNPTSDMLNVVFGSATAQDLTLRVINNVGQVVATQNLTKVIGSRVINMDVNHLANGIYTLEIQNGKGSVTRRVAIN